MIHLYQIGNVSLMLRQETWHGDELESEASFRSIFQSQSNHISFQGFVVNPVKVKVEGLLVSNKRFTASQQLQNLKRLMGQPLPLIGYFNYESRETECDDCTLIWVETFGVLQNVQAEQKEMNGLV